MKLLKVGGPLGDTELDVLRRAGVHGLVRQVSHVSTEELARIYRAATVLLYPSFYEGFGRPVLEAMASGLPVVASTAGAIPEVAGGAAALFDPGDVEGMATRVAEISDEPRLRQRMSAAGMAASGRFTGPAHGSWAVADAYRQAASR